MKLTRLILVLGFIMMVSVAFAQTTNDYRTTGSGGWTSVATWQRYNGSVWVAATAFPTYLNANVTAIRSGHTITVSSDLKIDRTIVDSGGAIIVTANTLTIEKAAAMPGMQCFGNLKVSSTGKITSGITKLFMENGSIYEHARNNGAYPLAAWEIGSTLLITGLTTTSPTNTGQNFYNVIWDCPGQTAIIVNPVTSSYHTVRGTLKVEDTGTGLWRWGSTATATKLIENYEQSGGTVEMAGSGCTKVSLTGSFVMSGGTLTTSPFATSCGWDFLKAGTQIFNKSGGTISETIYFKVASGTILNIVNQPITGKGAFTLISGAGLIIRDADGITSSGATGAVQVTGTRDFNTGADYTYAGIVAQSSGNGLPVSVSNLTVDNAAGVNFTQVVTVEVVFAQIDGAVSGSAITTDAYSSMDYKLLEIVEDENLISGFSIITTPVTSMPNRIDREWTINGSFSGTKIVTFYWDESEDNNFNWDILIPAVYIVATMYTANDYDVSSNPRWVTVDLPSFDGDTYTIGRDDGGTLPVELSSFTVATNSYNQVNLQWVTQSETNVSGFRIYRNTEDLLDSAQMLNYFIPATNTSQMKVYIATDKEIYAEGIYYYWLENVDLSGESGFHGPIHINVAFANPPTPEVPLTQGISSTYPNPFNPIVNISCGMEKAGQATVQIYNTRGQLVKTLFTGNKDKGKFLLQWNGTDQLGRKQPSGIYLIRMDSNGKQSLRKVVLSE
ncbi:MAG: FlgD immunoglobulin-like domain containing protein [Candidatus Cloacimonetes bacterium]|nr:FlgD immunoglobulin-like domain containing protein [Candidatus Cloacimonadota bacterium]